MGFLLKTLREGKESKMQMTSSPALKRCEEKRPWEMKKRA
jgi:hypothetical protein